MRHLARILVAGIFVAFMAGGTADAQRAPDSGQQSQPEKRTCCMVCKKGKPCGNSCIAASKTCHKPPGCAC